ncbi:Conserved_hypothetical protein [Hexamita inflata]|uniref:Uncharacterized protein n=1 Tax=Hexamita inflata TaxID=28002 RepID=A0AA86PEM9_9EUKA|nr:Conserved hypothetical protein [Hexamita inflata]
MRSVLDFSGADLSVILDNTLQCRMSSFTDMCGFVPLQIQKKFENILATECERVRLECDVYRFVRQEQRDFVFQFSLEQFLQVLVFLRRYVQTLKFTDVGLQREIQQLTADTSVQGYVKVQIAIQKLFAAKLTEFATSTDKTLNGLTKLHQQFVLNAENLNFIPTNTIENNLYETAIKNYSRILNNMHFRRCTWRPEELQARKTDANTFISEHRGVVEAEKIKLRFRKYYKHTEEYIPVAKPRPEKEYQNNQQLVQRTTSRAQLQIDKLQGTLNTDTFKQTLKKEIYPPPPSTDDIMSFATVVLPLQFKFSVFFGKSILHAIPSIKTYQLEQTLLNLIQWPIFVKKQLQKGANMIKQKSTSDIFEQYSELSKQPSTVLTSMQHSQSILQQQLVQTPVPIDQQQLSAQDMFYYSQVHWSQLQTHGVPELVIHSSLGLFKCAVQTAIETKRVQIREQQHVLHDWVDKVLKIAIKQKIPSEYAPILSDCGKYRQYININTGIITKIHPEIVKMQKIISEQYYNLENKVKIQEGDEILSIIETLEQLINHRMMIDQWADFNEELIKNFYRNTNQLLKSIRATIEMCIIW